MSQHPKRPTPSIGSLGELTTLSVLQAGELLGLGRSAAYEAVRRGDIPSRRIGRRILVPAPALIRWLGGDLNS